MDTEFLNPQALQEAIQSLVDNGMTYVEATLEFCDQADMEVEDLAKLLSDNLRQKLRDEYVENGYLKEEASLPI